MLLMKLQRNADKERKREERREGEGTGRVEEPQNFTHKWEQHVANADNDVDGAAVVLPARAVREVSIVC